MMLELWVATCGQKDLLVILKSALNLYLFGSQLFQLCNIPPNCSEKQVAKIGCCAFICLCTVCSDMVPSAAGGFVLMTLVSK